jgi:hypothetical protein
MQHQLEVMRLQKEVKGTKESKVAAWRRWRSDASWSELY